MGESKNPLILACDDISLNEMSKEEWRDATRIVRPDYTDEDFERDWKEFQEAKRRRQMQ